LDDVGVYLDGAINGEQVVAKGFEPLVFHVRQVSGNVGEEGHTSTNSILDPGHCNL
jgi:hypothetical protein